MPNFSDIEQRVNEAVNKKLANASADFGSGLVTDGTFGNEYAMELGLAEGSSPSFMCLSSEVSSVRNNAAVSITYQSSTSNYKVGSIHPDGTGMSLLILEKV